jgi:hypothetical protein
MPMKTLGPIGPRAAGERVKITDYCIKIFLIYFANLNFV